MEFWERGEEREFWFFRIKTTEMKRENLEFFGEKLERCKETIFYFLFWRKTGEEKGEFLVLRVKTTEMERESLGFLE